MTDAVTTDFNSWCLCEEFHEGHESWALLTPNQQINLKIGDIVAVWDFGGDCGVLATIKSFYGQYAEVEHDDESWMYSGSYEVTSNG